jgi:SAM-dependent methyltransferase
MIQPFSQPPLAVVPGVNRPVHCFATETDGGNIDPAVVASFGDEWTKFHEFSPAQIDRNGRLYFDILDHTMLNAGTYAIDVGCGTGRWTKYLLDRVGFMEAVDPSNAIFMADRLLGDQPNVRLSKAATDTLPFADETFDFGMSVGVLHHIPDTQKAMTDCVKKIKIGGWFYVYLYYDLENKPALFRILLRVVTAVRQVVSRLPPGPKKLVCDLIAVLVYMPLVLAGRLLRTLGLRTLADRMPLNSYQTQSFFVIRNDALDRFGTALEQRFSRAQVTQMMQQAGLSNIRLPDTFPYWHAVGQRVR